jgi:putative nucleotidyltransferase with HDIG domain
VRPAPVTGDVQARFTSDKGGEMAQLISEDQREKLALKIASQAVAESTQLPTLPSVVWEINRLSQDERASAADVERLILTDQVLTSKVLAFANSVYYGARSTISNIRQAIVRIGLNSVRDLVLGVGVIGAYHQQNRVKDFSMSELWRHSLGVAATCASLARVVPFSVSPEDAYTAGLLHDLGKPIMMTIAPEGYEAVIREVKARKVTPRQAEWDILGITHDLVGELYSRSVHFPARLGQAMRHHHVPEIVPSQPRIEVFVHVADVVINELGIGMLWGGAPPPLQPGAMELLGLQTADLMTLAEKSCQNLDAELALLL